MHTSGFNSFDHLFQGADQLVAPPYKRQRPNHHIMGSILGDIPAPIPMFDAFTVPSTSDRMFSFSEPLSRHRSSECDSFIASSPASPMLPNSLPGFYSLQSSDPDSPALSQFQDNFSGPATAASPYSSQSVSTADANSPRVLPDDSQGESSSSGRDYPVVCLYAGCDAKPFKRRADLDRHYKHKHAPESQKESYFCDYPKCARRKDPFHRRDHFRDHLREFHKEDIEKRGGSVKEEWLDGRNTSSSWWRCAKCLARIYVDKSGYECPACKTICQPKRKAIRQKD